MTKDEVLNEIAAGFEYEGWSVERPGDGALVLERGDDAYRVEMSDAKPRPAVR
jgi:hypothetical protein